MSASPSDRFDKEARAVLLSVKGVGETVIARFEQLGIATLPDLAGQDEEDLRGRIAALLGSSCWRNSPQAKRAVQGAIAAAREFTAG